ncbi:MAG: Trk system potassium transport protein TrkA [Planctomycetes bacterium RBG_16_64_12]|nr:MAG: Trk system potassium transport protein TrkA [Planctomycetes bacterium RBG_16_64_12]
MRIVVLGAGTVGTSIAELLCQHRHNVTVVDRDAAVVQRANDELDVRAVTGSAAQSSVLFQAGVLGADLCLAVTGSDEGNLIAASIAKAMGARRTVARVYAPVFRDLSTFDYQRHFQIDRLLSMEHLSAMELAREIRHPGSITVENFARGELEMQIVDITEKTSSVGVALKDLHFPKGVRIGSIDRGGKLTIARADDQITLGDRISLVGTRDDIDDVKEWFEIEPPQKIGVVIAGGGETGYHLARVLEGRRCGVVLMETNRQRCEFLAAHLKHTTVVNADAQCRSSLEEERAGSADVFVASTGDDEDNIMACVEAKELGAKRILAIVGRPDYANVVGKLGIDKAVSPREVVAKQVLGFLNTGPVISKMPLSPGGTVDILEIEVVPKAPATEHVLANVNFPPQCLIAAMIHENYVKVPGADDRLSPGDTVVALVQNAAIEDTVKLFTTNGTLG